jgi:hypothetical protein
LLLHDKQGSDLKVKGLWFSCHQLIT